MKTITVTTDDGTQLITATDDHDPDRAVAAHGFDPAAVETAVTDSLQQRVSDLEDRVLALEDPT
jgi:hypothetical protein